MGGNQKRKARQRGNVKLSLSEISQAGEGMCDGGGAGQGAGQAFSVGKVEEE